MLMVSRRRAGSIFCTWSNCRRNPRHGQFHLLEFAVGRVFLATHTPRMMRNATQATITAIKAPELPSGPLSSPAPLVVLELVSFREGMAALISRLTDAAGVPSGAAKGEAASSLSDR